MKWEKRKVGEEYICLTSLFQSQTFDGLNSEVFLSDGTFSGQSDWTVRFNCLAKVV